MSTKLNMRLTMVSAFLILPLLFPLGAWGSETLAEDVQTPSVVVTDEEELLLEEIEEGEIPEDADPEGLLEEEPDEPVIETDTFTLKVSGRQTWGVRLGFGGSRALATVGLSPWVPALEQSLQADITGTALGFLTVEASFDDQLGPGFQHLSIKMDRHPWTGELGDFTAGVPELGVYNKKLLGARLTYEGEGFTVSGVAAREQGISETMFFSARSAQAEVEFSYLHPEAPDEPAAYGASVLGLYHQVLRRPFVEGFSEVVLVLPDGEELRAFLRQYQLEYLVEVIGPEPAESLDSGTYTLLRDEGDDVLLLRSDPDVLLRRRVREAIDEYNERHDLEGPEERNYPFVRDSDLEREFLAGLKARSFLTVDKEDYPLEQLGRRRYLRLGQRDVLEDTLELYVRLPGEEEFRPIDDPALAGYAWRLFAEQGVLRIDFPDEFFAPNAALRAEFEHSREGNVFTLGLSIVPESERVFLNGQRLTRGTDYSIDYEVGMLIMFRPLAPEDELRVEFERQRGALGVATDYERGVFAVTLSIPGIEGLEIALAQAADVGRPRPDTPTMPNVHSVVGVRLTGDIAGWDYSLSLGGSDNVFPPGENMRVPGRNQVNVIAEAQGGDTKYALIGHENGITVYDGRDFSHYGPAQGLGGRQVRDILALPEAVLVASEVGLTLVRLAQENPFDRTGSWERLRPDRPGEGFPGEDTVALARGGGMVYAAEAADVAWAPLEDLKKPEEWSRWALPEGAEPTALLWADGVLYLGCEGGLYARGEDDEGWERLAGAGGHVRDLLWHGDTLYVATPQGVRAMRQGQGAGWIAPGEDVLALAALSPEGDLWYGGPGGLWRQGDPVPVVSEPVRAVGTARSSLWAGDVADADYELDLWRVRDEVEELGPEDTQIEGRDIGSFFDPEEEQTARGVTGGLSLTRRAGEWGWQVDASSRWPGYVEIGSRAGTDAHGIGFSVSYLGDGPWSGRFGARWELSELSADPHSALTGRVEIGWSPGPAYTLRLTPAVRGEDLLAPDQLETGYRLNANWPGDTWSGKLSVTGQASAHEFSTSGKLEGSTTVNPLPSVSIELGGFRPYQSEGATGEQGADLTLRYSDSSQAVSWAATWRETIRHRLESDTLRWDRSLSGTLRWSAVELGAARWTPQLRLTLEDREQEDSWQVQLTGGLEAGDSLWQLGGTLGQGYRPATGRSQRSLTTSVQWEYRGWPVLTPTARWQGSWQFLSHPAYDDVLETTHDLTARLTWRFEEGWRNQLDLSYRTRDGSLSVGNSLSVPTEWGTASAEAKADWRLGRLEGDATASATWRLADMWSVRLQLGYAMTWRPGDPADHGLHAGASLTASF